MSAKSLVMLEDDLERIERFRAKLESHHPGSQIDVSRTAPGFISNYRRRKGVPDLICLDHDLFTDSPDDPDPGDGRDVTDFLITQDPIAPVLIHSTNASAADSMLFALLDHGWTADRIAPLGQDWIETYWYPTAMRMIS